MARRECCRRVGGPPGVQYFKPRGVPISDLEEIVLAVDELEAIRLADVQGLYQADAAEEMDVSRQTFGRILESAHRKVGQALTKGLAIRIEGGNVKMAATKKFTCGDCRHEWGVAYGTGRPAACPQCSGTNIHRAEDDRGPAIYRGRRIQRCLGRGGLGGPQGWNETPAGGQTE